MASLNRVLLVGNLTRDPVVRQTPSGTAVGDISIAVNESYTNKSGEQVETTTFVDVVVWGRQAETCAAYLTKGSPVLIEGRLQLDQWKTPEGENKSKMRVKADRVQFLGKTTKGGQPGAHKSSASPVDPAPHDDHPVHSFEDNF